MAAHTHRPTSTELQGAGGTQGVDQGSGLCQALSSEACRGFAQTHARCRLGRLLQEEEEPRADEGRDWF